MLYVCIYIHILAVLVSHLHNATQLVYILGNTQYMVRLPLAYIAIYGSCTNCLLSFQFRFRLIAHFPTIFPHLILACAQ